MTHQPFFRHVHVTPCPCCLPFAQDYVLLCASCSGICAVPQGYGTVRFESVEAAQSAIEKFHGSDCEGRTLTVKVDQYA